MIVAERHGQRSLPFGFAGEVVEHVRWAGTNFNAVVHVNLDEVRRRQAVGLGHILDFQLLEATSTLPYQQPVNWDDIDPVVAAVLDCAPEGVVDVTTDTATLVMRTPLELTGVYTVSSHEDALRRVGLLARVAPTGVVLRQHPRERLPQAVDVASRFGLGLSVLEDGVLRPMTAPTSTPQPGIGRTRVLEAVYGRWLRQTGIPAN